MSDSSTIKINRSNLQLVIYFALEELKREESTYRDPNFKSTLRAGLEEVLKGLRNGDSIEIIG